MARCDFSGRYPANAVLCQQKQPACPESTFMEMEIKIEHITIKIGDKTVELTPDEARRLKLELDSLFPEPVWRTIPQPYPVPVNPWPTWTTQPGWPNHGIITCGHGGLSSIVGSGSNQA